MQNVKDKPNKVTATLKVIITGEFYDDDASEETLRYVVEQDLEDAGFDVDVMQIKEQPEIVRCKDCMHSEPSMFSKKVRCKLSLGYHELDWFCPEGERKQS